MLVADETKTTAAVTKDLLWAGTASSAWKTWIDTSY